MSRLGDIRNNFVKMRGGKLISAEAFVLGCVVVFSMIIVKDTSPYLALAVGFVVGFVFPILVGTFKSFAWMFAIFFSLIWAVVGFVFAGAIWSAPIGVLVGIIVFVISFMIHKNYSGLTFQGVSRNNAMTAATVNSSYSETVVFCPECGRRITSSDGKCDFCNR